MLSLSALAAESGNSLTGMTAACGTSKMRFLRQFYSKLTTMEGLGWGRQGLNSLLHLPNRS